ncbi:MAG: UDP-N-acetylglucosamine 2-epimerase (non-hydrolyzing) [Proteobacteria bacterium]|nr:UDP-N-acetylglucosamine 2-epimerase (non-hydrolyzing) [Pseudomonadota bacterium]
MGVFKQIRQPRIALVAGTRPECLKLASVAKALRAHDGSASLLINSGQHRAMVERTLAQHGLAADVAAAQCESGSLSATLQRLRTAIRGCLRETAATLVVAQGDTSTAYATALAARDLGLPLAHVEAGLRTSHPLRPFPEEHFRRRIARLADLHFAPTASAERNLRGEGIAPARIFRVGQTSIDLLRETVQWPCAESELPSAPATPHLIVLTLHRRENYGRGLDVVCAAVLDLLAARPDVGVLCPVHPNPAVGARIRQHLAAHPRIVLTEPLDFRPFISLLARATLAITDSGGIQEEAPYLGTPILIARENTERPESLALGNASLVAVDAVSIAAAARHLLDAPRPTALAFDASAPYGDGRAGMRIAEHLVACHRGAIMDEVAAPLSLCI